MPFQFLKPLTGDEDLDFNKKTKFSVNKKININFSSYLKKKRYSLRKGLVVMHQRIILQFDNYRF